ncbi:MAG: putative ABC transporter ATP-binding protein YknY [Firmicutes bacterium]|nr:putative ABC transporter ATP-binding protein YknY [Bacillota bacterium]
MIELKNLGKTYKMGQNSVVALDSVSLDISKGEFVAVIGPSGSGKSTLMNILGCLDAPTSGSYTLDGRDISQLSDNQLAEIRSAKIGFVFQGYNLLAKLNALQNVELPAMYLGLGAGERIRRAKEALEMVGLSDRMHHRPSELSGGQQQRVAIARALVNHPSVIMADEPTGNLDSKSGADIMRILGELNGAGNTIVMITHDQNLAEKAKRVLKIFDGKIVSDKGRSGI